MSPDGGTEPVWSRMAVTLYFRRANQLVAVPVTPGAEFRLGEAAARARIRYAAIDGARNYDVSPDGKTFVVVRSEGAADADQFNVVLNWLRGAEITKMSDKSRVHRPPRPTTPASSRLARGADRPRLAASLDAWLARDWSQAVHVASLEEFQQLHICTQNTLYELIVVNHCRRRARSRRPLFP